MASQTSKILVSFEAKDSQLAAAFKKLGRQSRTLEKNFTSLSDKGIRKIRDEFNKMAKGSTNSLQSMRAQKNALMGLRDQADVTGLEFKQLTADIAALDARMRKAGTGATGFKGKLKGFAKGAGAIAAGGIFGGPEGAIGGAIGLKFGGPLGAATGAAIGAQVGMVRKSLGEVAAFSAELALQRKALKLVIGDIDKYNESQKFLAQTSRKLAIPQDVITRQFTSLTASVVGAGKSVSDAEKVFQAIAAGIRGTGGSLEDMKAAMRATSQVFSKGKVSAEELRQQLGERLPGAFTLFAESMGKTPAELDKALEQGKVTLDDFMKFSQTLFKRYGKNAEILASGPEAAGDRLRTAMAELKDNVGSLLRPIGANFQTEFAKIVVTINDATNAFKNFFKIGDEFKRQNIENNLRNLLNQREKIKSDLEKDKADLKERQDRGENPLFNRAMARLAADIHTAEADLLPLDEKIKLVKNSLKALIEPIVEAKEKTEELKDTSNIAFEAMGLGVSEYMNSIKDMSKQIKDTFVNAFKGMEDALVQFVLTGKLNFRSLAQSIIADLTRMIVRQQMFNALSGFRNFGNFLNFSRLPSGPADNIADKISGSDQFRRSALDAFLQVDDNATGNAFAKHGIVPYRTGGIVNSPTMFRFGGSNLGIMGEAGPEAILPLQRGRGGKLGVIAQGGSTGNITVNVDATGSSVEGDDDGSRQLGEVIASAIQSQLIEEKRPGGLLA
tara:strand:+ start:59 stop:2242 length:2184 start_codon:yes stop_codon:yes gene_type:complete